MPNALGLPLFYHPTTVLLIDDDQALLNGLSLQLSEINPTKAINSPKSALNYLNANVYTNDCWYDVLSENYDYLEVDQPSTLLNVDFSPLLKGLNNTSRFDKIGVVVIDKAMPEMDGIEFCRQVKALNLPVKLILLTGATAASEIIAAFNNKIIDAYVSKDEEQALEKVQDYCQRFARQMFKSVSGKLEGLLTSRSELLNNELFQDAFYQVCLANHIVEYYLLDLSGSYLLIDKLGKAYVFAVKSEAEVQELIEIAQNNNAPAFVLNALAEKSAIPCIISGSNCFQLEGEGWSKYMAPATHLSGSDLYYAMAPSEINMISSFADYCANPIKPEVLG